MNFLDFSGYTMFLNERNGENRDRKPLLDER